MILHNKDLNETYHIRYVPLHEAIELSKQGVVFYDYTKLTAINTCPTFGVLRYALHRTDVALSGRNLALEAGKACHDFFAALRMWTLLNSNEDYKANRMSVAHPINQHGLKLFGFDRWSEMLACPSDGDPQHNAQLFALSALHSSGYYDDPSDRRRTLANMEVACITYTDRYFKSDMPVLIRGDFIGVEVPFVVEIEKHDHNVHVPKKGTGPNYSMEDFEPKKETHYYCGRIDGVHEYGTQLTAAENKTAGRIDNTWRSAFHMTNQVTGYTIALSTILNEDVSNAVIMGTQIPVPVRDVYAGVAFEPVSRTESDKLRWCEWFFHSVSMYEQWIDKPTLAPRYTHSCNRYFSVCQFLPFCCSSREEQQELLDLMRVEEWSPLDHLANPQPVGE